MPKMVFKFYEIDPRQVSGYPNYKEKVSEFSKGQFSKFKVQW